MEKRERRRHISLSFSKGLNNAYVSITSEGARVFGDEAMTNEVLSGRRSLEVELPFTIKKLEVKRAMLSPIVELGINRKLWPMDNMQELRLIFDNRNILMVDNEGQFRENKYKQLCACLSWKNWVLVQYKDNNGEIHATLYWKDR